MKNLFSFYLDDDIKIQANKMAAEQNRSLSNLIETAIQEYIKPRGARVTVKTVRMEGGKKVYDKHTAHVIHVDQDEQTVLLNAADPKTGRNVFFIKDIEQIHLI